MTLSISGAARVANSTARVEIVDDDAGEKPHAICYLIMHKRELQ